MEVALPLDRPPIVVSLGVGRHGQAGPRDRFLLPDLWAFHLYRYSAVLTLDGEQHRLAPGTVSLVPPGTVTEYRYEGVSEHLYVHLRPAGEARRLPAVQPAGTSVAVLTDLLSAAVTSFPHSPPAATAAVWAALWRVAGLTPPGPTDAAAARLAPVLALVESSLAGPLPVAELARAAAVTPTHLTRLFRQLTGSSAVGYVRGRRAARAEHLLRHTTLPVLTVARSVGVPDLQAFNKLCHALLGGSPREVRAGVPRSPGA